MLWVGFSSRYGAPCLGRAHSVASKTTKNNPKQHHYMLCVEHLHTTIGCGFAFYSPVRNTRIVRAIILITRHLPTF